MRKMIGGELVPNIVDYLTWRGDIKISASPFNEIDSLIITQLAMIELDGIVPASPEDGYISVAEAAEIYFGDEKKRGAHESVIIPPETYGLFELLGKSERFGELKLTAFVSHTDTKREKQFAGLTVKLPDGSYYVVFRGTDDSIVGWKEDFNMAFMSPIPAQVEAVEYLDRIGRKIYGKIRVGGHSKGGNLALYSAVKCTPRIRRRIINVYNYDAPGFSREFLESPEYISLGNKILSLVPQSSIVGMIFENDKKYRVVKSTEVGIMQHNAFSWEVYGKNFVELDQLTSESREMTRLMNDLMLKMDLESRKKFIDAIYEILISTNATTITQLSDDKYSILRALKNTDKETRRMVFKTLSLIFGEGGKHLAQHIIGSLFKTKKHEQAMKLIQEGMDILENDMPLPEENVQSKKTEKTEKKAKKYLVGPKQ